MQINIDLNISQTVLNNVLMVIIAIFLINKID